MSGGTPIPVVVSEVTPLNDLVTRFRFRRRDGLPFPAFSGGAHTVVEMDDHGTRRRNPYSLMGDPADTAAYSISVRRDDAGRGGSLYLHRHVRPGSELVLSHPVNLFPLDLRARKHLFIAGGIGITPFLAMIHQCLRLGLRFELHYTARTRALGAYMDDLERQHGRNVRLYLDDQDQRLDLSGLLARQPLGTALYVCGPKPMIAWVLATARDMGWPEAALHSEEFLAPPTGAPFRASLARSGIGVTVGPHQSLLEAIEAAGLDPPYLCRGGACGQCETDVLACEGRILHNDHWLTDAQKASGTKIMPCVSRIEGPSITLDR